MQLFQTYQQNGALFPCCPPLASLLGIPLRTDGHQDSRLMVPSGDHSLIPHLHWAMTGMTNTQLITKLNKIIPFVQTLQKHETERQKTRTSPAGTITSKRQYRCGNDKTTHSIQTVCPLGSAALILKTSEEKVKSPSMDAL